MGYNCKNKMTDGGDTLVIGGKLKVEAGATVEGIADITANDATKVAKGLVQIGDNISVDSGVISVPAATGAALGVVQVGDGLAVADGVVSLDAPDAAADTKGVVLQGVAVADAAGAAPTAAEFKALLDSLRDAGIIATAESEG